jgi:hypothetical protein
VKEIGARRICAESDRIPKISALIRSLDREEEPPQSNEEKSSTPYVGRDYLNTDIKATRGGFSILYVFSTELKHA